jgi:hypothetical protein
MEQLNKKERRRSRIDMRNQAIRDEYTKLCSKKIKNVKVYSEEIMILKISEKFFLAEKTIEDIIYNRLAYEKTD